MSSQQLPSANADDVKLVVATAEELRTTWQYNSAEWRGPLSLEAYERREEHLLNQDLTKEGGLTSWILVHQPQSADGARTILCACETLRKRALVAVNGQVREGICHGVASVFCPAEHRGRGYAGKMIEELAKKIKHWQQDSGRVLFSILYSDIGRTFYGSRGWQPFQSSHIQLPAASLDGQPHARFLTADEIPTLCEQDTKLLHKELENTSTTGTTVAVIPDVHTIRWHHARAEFFAKELLGKDIVHKGAFVELPDGRRAWCYWQHNWYKTKPSPDNKLYILRIVLQRSVNPGVDDDKPSETADADLLEPLLVAAQAEAEAWNLHCVEWWSPSSASKIAAQRLHSEAQEVHRQNNCVNSLQWFGEGDWRNVRWVCNERYAWC